KRAISPIMLELGLCLVPEEYEEMNVELFEKGKTSCIKYMNKFSLVNADNPEERQTFIFPVVGMNNDGFDKASGSAITYAEKYLFNLNGLIPDERLDPDVAVRLDKKNETGNEATNTEPVKIQKLNRVRFIEKMKELGLTLTLDEIKNQTDEDLMN